jgi:hypothetical protein
MVFTAALKSIFTIILDVGGENTHFHRRKDQSM